MLPFSPLLPQPIRVLYHPNYSSKMGKSEWGIVVRTKADAQRVLDVAAEHNAYPDYDVVGEPIEVYALLRFRGHIFIILGNGGGRESTAQWLVTKLPSKTVIWHPFRKPKEFCECRDYAWQAGAGETDPARLDVDTLPLTDA